MLKGGIASLGSILLSGVGRYSRGKVWWVAGGVIDGAPSSPAEPERAFSDSSGTGRLAGPTSTPRFTRRAGSAASVNGTSAWLSTQARHVGSQDLLAT